MSIENDRANKINSRKSARKPALTNSITSNATPPVAKELKPNKEDKVLATLNAIKADVDNLKAAFAKQEQHCHKPIKKERKFCQQCASKGTEDQCDHCSICGSSEHSARGCRQKNQGNRRQLHLGGTV